MRELMHELDIVGETVIDVQRTWVEPADYWIIYFDSGNQIILKSDTDHGDVYSDIKIVTQEDFDDATGEQNDD